MKARMFLLTLCYLCEFHLHAHIQEKQSSIDEPLKIAAAPVQKYMNKLVQESPWVRASWLKEKEGDERDSTAVYRSHLGDSLSKFAPIEVFSSDAGERYFFADQREVVKPSTFRALPITDTSLIFEVEVFNPAKSHYGVSVRWFTTKPVKKGDVLLARITLRTRFAKQESGESVVYFYFQQANRPHDKSFITSLSTGSEWKTYDIPFTAKHDFPAGEASVCLSFGSLSQKVEITGVKVLNFENKIQEAQLPVTLFTYAGREANAQWRNDALKRIEKIRTAPLRLKLVDADNHPVQGALIKGELIQSDFVWGTSVNEALLGDDLQDSKVYRSHLMELFNSATIENGLKAEAWNEKRKAQTIRAFEWLHQNDFRQRAHTLVWPAWKFNSPVVKELAERDTALFNKYIKEQFHERMGVVKGRVIAWDVLNEYMHEKDFFQYLPQDIEVEWYKMARELDPEATLFINDYGMLNSIESPRNIMSYVETIQQLVAKGAPIDAIGIQGHIGRHPRNPQQVITDLDLFLPTGLPVQITEFDINTPDEELQADYTRDFLIACYSHPVITGITLWGFWESKHWKPDAGMFRKDWTPKPNADVWRKWVTGEWKTAIDTETDKNGEINVRGHLGRYKIRVEYQNYSKLIDVMLTKDSKQIVLKITNDKDE